MAETELLEVFRGHFKECLTHLGEQFKRATFRHKHDIAAAKEPIATFCDVNRVTVANWLGNSEGQPVGETLIKLMCLLDLQGYRIIELESMPKPHRHLVELIGFGLLSAVEVAELLGYSKLNSLYNMLKGEQEAGGDKEEKIWALFKDRQQKEALEEKKRVSREKFRLSFIDIQPDQPIAKEPASNHKMHDCCQKVSVGLMENLLVLFDEGLLSNLSEKELEVLHQTAGSKILKLSAHLSALSSRLYANQSKTGGG